MPTADPAAVPQGPRRILSGVQSSGKLHLGNYFGAIRQHIALQNEGECFFFIADYHALTSIRDTARKLTEDSKKPVTAPELMREYSHGAALDYLALGLDPDRVAFFRQSDVPEVTELAWILGTVTNMGLLERAHSYKDKLAQGIEPSVGLFTYPVLMAADILIYRSHLVPVGEDQVQHLEMTRDMAGRFNRAFGDIFPEPRAYVLPEAARVPGLDGQKMSKSKGNTIDIFAEGNALKKRVMSIVTDPKPLGEPLDPDNNTVFTLYTLVATPEERRALAERYRAGTTGYGEAKKLLLEAIERHFAPARERRKQLAQDPSYVEGVLERGARKARAEAQATMELVRTAVGFRARPA
jgi:tryptophanyl-tRNA synthetase